MPRVADFGPSGWRGCGIEIFTGISCCERFLRVCGYFFFKGETFAWTLNNSISGRNSEGIGCLLIGGRCVDICLMIDNCLVDCIIQFIRSLYSKPEVSNISVTEKKFLAQSFVKN